jgi:hypothetical protein
MAKADAGTFSAMTADRDRIAIVERIACNAGTE